MLKGIAYPSEMASLRRSKALSPDGQTARFLYTILKQLDLKTIDWNLVADGLDITNGHAARMRFSRFKQHMGGIPSQPRIPRPKKEGIKDTKNAKGKGQGLKRVLDDTVKQDGMNEEDIDAVETNVKPEPGTSIKAEPGMKESSEHEKRPAVRVKREPVMDGIASQPTSERRFLALPGDVHEMVSAATPAFDPSALVKIEAKPPIVSPVGTVSLADLHLSTNSIPPATRFNGPAPSFVLGPKPGTPRTPGDVAVFGIKSESGLMGSMMPATSGQTLVKSEPVDL